MGRWSRGQAERGQGEDAGSTHTARPPSPSAENSRAPRITPGTSLASLPRSAGASGPLPQLAAHPTAPCHSPGRARGAPRPLARPALTSQATTVSTPSTEKTRPLCQPRSRDMTYLKADVVPAPRKLHPNGATGLTTLTELVVRAVRVALAEMGECWGYRADPWLLWGRSVAWQAAGRERPQAERAEGCSTVRGTVTEARMVLRWQGGKHVQKVNVIRAHHAPCVS